MPDVKIEMETGVHLIAVDVFEEGGAWAGVGVLNDEFDASLLTDLFGFRISGDKPLDVRVIFLLVDIVPLA